MTAWNYSDLLPEIGDKICFVLKNSQTPQYGIYTKDNVSTPDRLIPWKEIYMWKPEKG